MNAIKTLWERHVDAVRTCTRYNWHISYFKAYIAATQQRADKFLERRINSVASLLG